MPLADDALDPMQLLRALRSLKEGDFSVRLPQDAPGIDGETAEAFNDIVEMNELLARELERVSAVAGKGGKISLPGKLLGATGSWRRCVDSINTLIGNRVPPTIEGTPKEILGTCLAATDRRRLEQQLLQSQKMEALGQLTGGIAHDFNNMLSVVIWNLDRVAQSLPAGKLRDQAQLAMSGALNCAELTRQLLTFARHQPDQPKVIRLPELGSRMAKLLGPVIGKHITINIRMSEGIWPIFADPARVESALLNLAINGRDAMENGGTLTIEGANVPRGMLDVDPTGEFVAMCVSDTGVGMSRDVIERAFEPFFTTKAPGEGTGLGLSMVYGFAKQARGHVKIDSHVGLGTTVRIYLPRCLDVPAESEAGEGDADIKPDRPRLVLVVEDDTDVRGMTVARLTEFGYRVREADCGAAALKALKEEGPVDLLFTDVVMPGGMSGLDLARRAVEVQPAMKVIFTSGYASAFHRADEELGELLQKPYSDDALRAALRRALIGRASRRFGSRLRERAL